MKRFGMLVAIFLTFASCGVSDSLDLSSIKPCTVTKSGSISTISCPDGSTTTISDGQSGSNGHSMAFETTQADASQCANGGTIIVIGLDVNDNGVLDLDSDQNIQSAKTCNGLNGQDGANGQDGQDGSNAAPTAFTPVKIITPCGPNSSTYKEILLVLQDGSILASFSENANGKNTRLALLPDGTYQDTDSSACTFTVSTFGHTRSISWSGGGDSWSIPYSN